MEVCDRYGWEVELLDHRVIRQYGEDGSENPSSLIPPAEVVRASVLPRVALFPRHDVLLDHGKGERFVRRFGRAFKKKTETNLDATLAAFKYALRAGQPIRVDYSVGKKGEIIPDGGVLPQEVRSVNRLTPMRDALVALRLTWDSPLTELLYRARAGDKRRAMDQQSPFFQQPVQKYGQQATMETVAASLGAGALTPLGFVLDAMGFPKSGTQEEYLHCLVTTHYRLWVFSSSGRALVTNPEYEVYL